MTREREKSPAQRRAERAHWPITRLRLRDEPPDDFSAEITPAACIAMMWSLAESAWKLAGRPLPTYDRRTMPARLFRAGTPRPLDDDA